jgi:myo-inositol-1(or 4)-monophosphatase
MHPYVNTAVRAARKAGETIVRGLARFEGVETATKGLNDFVTSIDHAAEAEIINILKTAYPHHAFLAEESGASGNADTTWIIDPLDGTTNFMHGFPQFAVSIACQVNDRIEHAVVYDPMRQEIFTATRGSGAYLENRRLRVSRQRTLQGALIGTGFPYRENLHYLDPYMAMLKTVMQTAAGVRRPGAAALDLAYVAAGRTDAFFEIGLKAWDTAAGTLLIRESGGLVGTLDGGEYRQNGNIVAGNPRVYMALIEALAPHLPAQLREAAQEQAAKEARAAAMAAVQAAADDPA